jgi:hypothetical protein
VEEDGAEVAGGEGVQGAQAAFEFGRGDAALAEEAAQKIFGGHFSLAGVAFDAAGNEITVGIAASAGQRDDMIEGAAATDEAPETIKTTAAFALVKSVTPAADLQEVQLLKVGGAGPPGEAHGHRTVERLVAYLVRQKDFGQVAGLGAVEEADSALGGEAAYGEANGAVRQADAARKKMNGKAELAPAFETAMAEEMGVHHTLGKIEAEARHEFIIELFPEETGIGFSVVVFHGWHPEGELAAREGTA